MSISGQRYNIIRDNIQRAISSVDKGITLLEITFSGQCHRVDKRYNIIRDNIQRAMSSVDKGITLLEITFSGQCHQ